MTLAMNTRPFARREAAAHPVRRAAASAGNAVLWLLGWPARYARARRNLATLAAMSDLQLKDIGLHRADVISATALPRDQDPTPQLAALVRERRHYRGVRRG